MHSGIEMLNHAFENPSEQAFENHSEQAPWGARGQLRSIDGKINSGNV